MIDLHSHILPGIDDGAKDLDMSLAMARIAVEDGTTHIACTPHFMSGVYDNTVPVTTNIITELEAAFRDNSINLALIPGGDIHIAPDIADRLANGTLPTLGVSNYFLFEPPHHVLPPGIVQLCKGIMAAKYMPVLTHPERLTWIEKHYDVICQLDELGVVVQLTAASITGKFGTRALYWSERMLDEGRVDIIASDAHNIRSRPPGLSRARDIIAARFDDQVAMMMVKDNPQQILQNRPVAKKQRTKTEASKPVKKGFWAAIGFE